MLRNNATTNESEYHDRRPKTLRIRELNDLFRTTWLTGTVLMTEGIRDLPDDVQSRIAEQVQTFSTFAGPTTRTASTISERSPWRATRSSGKSTATRPT